MAVFTFDPFDLPLFLGIAVGSSYTVLALKSALYDENKTEARATVAMLGFLLAAVSAIGTILIRIAVKM